MSHAQPIPFPGRHRLDVSDLPRAPTAAALPATASAPSSRQREGERVLLHAADGYPLAGHYFSASSGPARAHLVVAGATAVPQRFYRRFAVWAAARGYAVLTFDYRGIGESAPKDLRDFRLDYFDWGRLDLATAVDAMTSRSVPLHVVGHSYAGHAFGVLPNHRRVTGFCTFGTGAGWHGWMPRLERARVLALWHVFGPLLTGFSGYLSWSRLGMGEDLPLDFYRQWKRWCRLPRNFFDDPAQAEVVRRFEAIRTPILAVNATDDRWSPPRSRDAFFEGYRNAPRQTLDLAPRAFGLRRIGHLGYFRPEVAALWEQALDWLDDQAERRERPGCARLSGSR